LQGIDLGMRFTRAFMPAFANNLTIPDQHTAHARIRGCRQQATLCQTQRTGHTGSVFSGKHRQGRNLKQSNYGCVCLRESIIRQQGNLVLLLFRRRFLFEPLDLLTEGIYIFKTAVHGGKPDKRHLVQLA